MKNEFRRFADYLEKEYRIKSIQLTIRFKNTPVIVLGDMLLAGNSASSYRISFSCWTTILEFYYVNCFDDLPESLTSECWNFISKINTMVMDRFYETGFEKSEFPQLILDNRSTVIAANTKSLSLFGKNIVNSTVEKIFGIEEFPTDLEFNSIKFNGHSIFYFIQRIRIHETLLHVKLINNNRMSQFLMNNMFFRSISHRFNNKISNILGWIEHLKIEMKGSLPEEIITNLEDSCIEMINMFNDNIDFSDKETDRIEEIIDLKKFFAENNAELFSLISPQSIFSISNSSLQIRAVKSNFIKMINLTCSLIDSIADHLLMLPGTPLLRISIIKSGAHALISFTIEKEGHNITDLTSLILNSGDTASLFQQYYNFKKIFSTNNWSFSFNTDDLNMLSVIIRIPLHMESMEKAQSRKDILLVEDEPILTKIMLQTFAIKSLSCTNISSYEEFVRLGNEQLFSIAIIDMGISSGKGRIIAEELLKNSPGMKIIFTSGNDFEDQAESFQHSIFIKKPFRLEQLLSVIESCLE